MRKFFITCALLLAVVFSAMAQMPEMPQLPLDPAVRYGKLENGLTYYIRHNDLPEHHADFYIAQRVGSVLEEESQRGLAHFLEHMAFNGTKNFPGKNMLNYLERNGVKFGYNVNAYTAFDETVYNICDVPTTEDHPNIVDSCLLILHDWSGYLSLEDEEIDNERGVIHEEWRSRNDASQRLRENFLYPDLMPNTPYPNRMPIGLMEVVDNFKYDELRNYYKKWYRPDLQGIVIVGDVDVDYVENKIKEFWKDIQTPANAAVREYVEIEDNAEVLVSVGKDKEYNNNIIEFGFKSDKMPRAMRNTQIGVITALVKRVLTTAFNNRVAEAILNGKTQMIGGDCAFTDYMSAKTEEAAMFAVVFKENEWKPALDNMIDMLNTAATYGFSEAEIGRVKADILTGYENAYNERDKRKNSELTGDLINNFLEGTDMLDIETEYQMAQQLLEAIPTDVYNQTFKQAITDNNQFVFMWAQEKEGNNVPSKEELVKALKEGLAREAKPYEEKEVAAHLMTTLPKKGKIVKKEDTDFGFKVWTLSNGAKIVWKATDFKKDEISMDAISPVGYVNLSGLNKAEKLYLSTICTISGFSDFSVMDLSKVLAGKNASINVDLAKNSTSISGTSTPKDLRCMMEQLYLAATQPRLDQDAYDSWFKRSRSQLAMQEGTPNKILNDSLTKTLYAGQPEMYPITLEEFDQLNYQKMIAKGRELLKNAADFTFFMIGNIDEDSLTVMAEQYIAALPSANKPTKKFVREYETITAGSRENKFDLPMEQPMTTAYNVFCLFDKKYNLKETVAISLLGQIAQMVVTETIREKEAGVYSPGAAGGYSIRNNMMQFLYMFVTGADKLEHIGDVAYRELSKLGEEITEDHFGKARDFSLKSYQENLKENSYWLALIEEKMRFGNDQYTGFEDVLKSITIDDVKALAKEFFAKGSRVEFVANGVEKK